MKLLYDDKCSRKEYDVGIKDYFGRKITVIVDDIENYFRLFGDNQDYKKERSLLDKNKQQYIYVPKRLEIVNVTKSTLNKLENLFPGVGHPKFELTD